MKLNKLFEEIKKRNLSLGDEALQTLLSHLDQDYLSQCTSTEIADHLELSQSLTPQKPVQVRITQSTDQLLKFAIIAYDYFSEFSIICGLLSSFGVNIEGGSVQTIASGTGRKKIVDLFYVRAMKNQGFDTAKQTLFKEQLETLIVLLEKGHFKAARAEVNRDLIAHISKIQGEKTKTPLQGLLAPIQIHFDNKRSPQWTILDIHGKDTPVFLYAFSNALAMRNIYIHKIKIAHQGDQIHDRLYIVNRHGKKILKETDRKALQIAAVLIKEFMHFLTRAPDPAMAITHFEQFLDKILETKRSRPLIGFLKQKETMELLARFFGTSSFLWEDFLRIRFDSLFPILEQYKRKQVNTGTTAMRGALGKRLQAISHFEEKRKAVNDYKDQELFRIDLSHLHEPDKKLHEFSEALTRLAEVIVSAAYQICDAHLKEKYGTPRLKNGRTVPFTLFGLGKFGGKELGYASDIELLFVYGENGTTDGPETIDGSHYFEKLAQEIIGFIDARQEGIFQIDTRLRPYGNAGRLAIAYTQFKSYYSATGKAAPFERQALIKLRTAAGSRSLGKKCETARDQFVYSGAPWDFEEAFALRQRQMEELVPKGRINVKYSPGGIIDIEYLVQYLQILHGERFQNLRTTNTLQALFALVQHQVISKKTAQTLKKTYLFLRRLIDAMRMVRGNARDLLLPAPESEEFIFLARRMGYAKKDWQKGRLRLTEAVSSHMKEAHTHYQAFLNTFHLPA